MSVGFPPAPGNHEEVDIDVLGANEVVESTDDDSDPDLQKKLEASQLAYYGVIKSIVEQEFEQFARENKLEASSSAEIELYQHDTRTSVLALVGRQVALNMVSRQIKDAYVEANIRSEARRLFAAIKPYLLDSRADDEAPLAPLNEAHDDFGAAVRYHVGYINRARTRRSQELRRRRGA